MLIHLVLFFNISAYICLFLSILLHVFMLAYVYSISLLDLSIAA